jgi:hypothetical protein
MAEGSYIWPRVVAPLAGQVHLMWTDVDGSGWTHRSSADYGTTWSPQQQVRGFGGVPGPVGLTVDGAGGLYLVGLGRDESDKPALIYSAWALEGERWEAYDPFPVDMVDRVVPGVALTLLGGEGQLDAVFRADLISSEGAWREVLHARRQVSAVEEAPEPIFTPVPTATSHPSPTPTVTPTQRPQVEVEPPAATPPSVGLGPVTLPVIAVAGLGLAIVIIFGVLVTSAQRRRR